MAKRQWTWICAGTVAAFMAAAGVRAQSAAILSVADGDISLIRGASVYATAPGIRIHEGDMLRTRPGALAVVELPDGSLLGLGPDTQAMVLAFRPMEVAALSGWIKVAQKGSQQAMPFRLAVPSGSIAGSGATAVLQVSDAQTAGFVESGSIEVGGAAVPAPRGASGAAAAVNAGEYVLVRRGERLSTSARPLPGFLADMPRAFRDALPALGPRYAQRLVEPKLERDVSYGEVEDWLKAPLAARRTFVKRFEPRIHDPEFRGGLVRHLQEHPEWRPVLFPPPPREDAPRDP